ncbi:hypothetical protein HDU92_006646 [Lobulomyces angularis]|nr:hypothetical protein HDU92_006646 [Lobulomyces angularis]
MSTTTPDVIILWTPQADFGVIGDNCDFFGNDLPTGNSAKTIDVESCYQTCKLIPECSHFSYGYLVNNTSNQICYFKSLNNVDESLANVSSGERCGIVPKKSLPQTSAVHTSTHKIADNTSSITSIATSTFQRPDDRIKENLNKNDPTILITSIIVIILLLLLISFGYIFYHHKKKKKTKENFSNVNKEELIVDQSLLEKSLHWVAIENYTPQLHDELEITPGDLIDVRSFHTDGWILGYNQRTGLTGNLPLTLLKPVDK